MIKQFTYVATGLLALSGAALYGASAISDTRAPQDVRERIERRHAEIKAQPRMASETPSTKVMGGANGDKQLYGIHYTSGYGSSVNSVCSIGESSFTTPRPWRPPSIPALIWATRSLWYIMTPTTPRP